MSFGSTISNASNASMPSQADPMDEQPPPPFSGPQPTQFSDIRPPVPRFPPLQRPQIQHTQAFNDYRDSRQATHHSIPTAPRYNADYNQPFVQWPTVNPNAPPPPPSAGTFESLRISDNIRQLPPAFQPAPVFSRQHQPHPGWAPAPGFAAASNQPAIIHQRQQELQHQQFPQLQYVQHQQQHYPVAVQQPHQVQHYQQPMVRDPSIDTISINTITVDNASFPRDTALLMVQPPPIPKPLTFVQKCKAFMGNDRLLALHAQRQAEKRRYARLY